MENKRDIVYVLTAGYAYEGVREINVFDSLSKAKAYCQKNYGLSKNMWSKSKDELKYFYDGDIDNTINMVFNSFYIYGKAIM